MAIEIKVLQRGDDSILTNVAAEVFDNPIDPELTREFFEDPRHHIAVAIDDGVVVGSRRESTTSIPTNRRNCGSTRWLLHRRIVAMGWAKLY